MLADLTSLDSLGWEALKGALNQRVVLDHIKFVPSKRNRVWIVETDVRPVVVKMFLSGRCGIEFENLLQAKRAGLEVPLPLAKSGDYLVTEYVPGESCETLINHLFSAKAAEGMGGWLAAFHLKMKIDGSTRIMGDAVPSNFILSNGGVCGVDLEDSVKGEPLEDIGQLASAFLGNEPFFTPIKFDLCFRMISSYEKTTRTDVLDKVRPYVSKHLQLDAKSRPLFRRTLIGAAHSIENHWPKLV